MPINLDQENVTVKESVAKAKVDGITINSKSVPVKDMTSNVDAMFSHFNLAKMLESYESTFTSYNFTSSIGSCCIAGEPETNRSTFIKLHDGEILIGLSRNFSEQGIYEYLMLGTKTLIDIVDISSVFNAAKHICNDAGLEKYFIEITAASIYINVRRFLTKESVTQVVDNVKITEKNNLPQENVNVSTTFPLIDAEALLSQFKLKSRNYRLDNIYQELVTFDNIQPSELMLRTLHLYRKMYQRQQYEGYELCVMYGSTSVLVLLPEISQQSNIFTDNDDENNEILHSYSEEFFGIFNHRMFGNDYCCICFIHEHDGIRDGYQFICQWDKNDTRIPPVFIKAADIYCRLYDVKPVDHPFIFGAMMLSTSMQEDELDTEVDNYIENIDDWFLNGVVNYLAKVK